MSKIEALLAEYLSECREILSKAEENVLELENRFDQETVNSLFRYIHTVKGNSGIFEFKNLFRLSHLLENLLGQLREKKISITKELIDLLLCSIDRIKNMLNNIAEESSIPIDDLVERIKNFGIEKQTLSIENKPTDPNLTVKQRKIPDEFAKLAQEKKQNLFVIYFDLHQQKFPFITDFFDYTNQFSDWILHKEIIEENVLFLEEEKEDSVPYYLVILSPISMNEFLQKYPLEVIETFSIYEIIPSNVAESTPQLDIKKNTESNQETHIKVRISLLDDLINLVGETIITRNQLLQRFSLTNDSEEGIVLSRLSQLITQMHDKVMHTRLQELNLIYQRINRVVRDTARTLNKEVNLKMEGGEVELDKTMIDVIGDSIIHIIRNSMDHGLESIEDRTKLGKNPIGTIRLSAMLQSGNVQLIIEDDGRGISPEFIKNSAIKKGVISTEQASKMSDEEVIDLIFLPGFSTASQVTDVSGRGVGMDVVRTSFKKLGGSVKLYTKVGQGMKIVASLPQTVSVVSCLFIKTDDMRLAIYRKNIIELIQFEDDKYSFVNNHEMYNFRDRMIPVVNLRKLLFPEEAYKRPQLLVIVQTDIYYYGILFDEMIEFQEIVVKPLGEFFTELKMFSGATIMGDGEPVIIIDVTGIGEFASLPTMSSIKQELKQVVSRSFDLNGYLLFISSGEFFASNSTSVICIEKVERSSIEYLSGKEVIQYRDTIIPVRRIEHILQIPEKESKFTYAFLIIISVDKEFIGILVDEIVDVVKEVTILDIKDNPHNFILGQSIINKTSTLILDLHKMFKKMSNTESNQRKISL